MKVLLLCGVFAKENEGEVIAQAKKSVEFSANQMQLKLIRGFNMVADTQVISAPFIGHYPNQSRRLYFSGFTNAQTLCKYVHFNNIWGYRNLSRTHSLKKAVRSFALAEDEEKLIVVYSAHDPFLAAAAYAKRLDPKIKICSVVPDLPQYMNLEAKRGILYDFFKRFDIKSIQEHMKSVDSSVVLTEAMARKLQLTDRPYVVSEGIVDAIPDIRTSGGYKETINIVYAGKLYFKFGIKALTEAFSLLKHDHCRLILCGNGDAFEYLQKCAEKDPRIILPGQVSPEKVQEYIRSAAVLVNPRPNNEEYTKYSFPSKDIEYLLSGKPTVAFLLDGMPECYRDFLYVIEQGKEITSAIYDALAAAISATESEAEEKHTRFLQYAEENLLASAAAEKIIRMNWDCRKTWKSSAIGKEDGCERIFTGRPDVQKVRVVQQYVTAASNGGLKTEYEALSRRDALTVCYEFIPVVLTGCHCGVSVSDIRFYCRAIRKADPDIVHIRGAGMESLNAVLGAKLSGCGKILVTVHGMFSDLVYYSPIKRWICRHIVEPVIFGLSDGISCVSEKTSQRDIFRRFKGKMLPCVYNRIPSYPDCSAEEKCALRRELGLPVNGRIGVYVGRVTKEKGLSYLVGALKLLDENWPSEFCLLLVGDGDYLQEMQAECAALQHSEQVIFAGQQDAVQKYLQASDFFLSPSLHENLSISILEACAAKLPCLVTDVGGNSEIIEDGKNGVLIAPFSAEALSLGLRKLCDDEFRSQIAHSENQVDYGKFSDEQVDRQLGRVYAQLLQR